MHDREILCSDIYVQNFKLQFWARKWLECVLVTYVDHFPVKKKSAKISMFRV